MDKSWMSIKDRLNRKYKKGVDNFLVFAFSNKEVVVNNKILCPCINCNNSLYKERAEVREDIIYTNWYHHEEDIVYS